MRRACFPSKIQRMSESVGGSTPASNDVLAVAPGTWPVGSTGVTIFFIFFAAAAIYMAIAYVKRRK